MWRSPAFGVGHASVSLGVLETCEEKEKFDLLWFQNQVQCNVWQAPVSNPDP